MKYGFCALAVAAAVVAGPAWGQQPRRTFVSGKGADTGNCPLMTPCRSFQAFASISVNGSQTQVDAATSFALVQAALALMYKAGASAPWGVSTLSALHPVWCRHATKPWA